MPRNFFRRIESLFPVEDPALRRRLKTELLDLALADEARAWQLRADGAYRRVKPKNRPPLRSQVEFVRLAESAAPPRSRPKPRPPARLFA
jgi:polyphosphate kinase